MRTTVIYIAPAAGALHHPQARIYRAEFEGAINADGVKTHYRNNPDRWAEVGLINYDGKLVCFAGTDAQRQELVDSQPLQAGLVYTYHDTEN